MARVGAIIISLRALTAMPCAVENGGNGYRAYGATVHPGNPRMGRMHNVILPALPITLSVSVSSPTSITGACSTRWLLHRETGITSYAKQSIFAHFIGIFDKPDLCLIIAVG